MPAGVAISSLTVIIPFYGDPTDTLTVCQALHKQDCPVPLTIIVADDASPTAFPDTPDVHVARRERNGGFGSAVNTGVEAARTSHVLILNSDVELSPTFLTDLINTSRPWMPAIVTCDVTGESGHTSWPGRHFPTISHQVTEWLVPLARWRHLPALHEAVGHDTRAVRHLPTPYDTPSDWILGALMLMPRDVFEALGGMDEFFYMNCEEVDFQRRARALGIPSVVVGGVSVFHEGGGSSASDRRRGWLVDGRYRYTRKWQGKAGVFALRAGLSTATAINLAWNSARALAGAQVEPLKVARYEWSLVTDPEQYVPLENRRL